MRFLARLGLGILLAAVAVGLNFIPFIQQTGIIQAVLRSIIVSLVLFGLWRGLAATSAPAATRNRWLTVAIVLVAWAAVAWTLWSQVCSSRAHVLTSCHWPSCCR